VLKRECVCVVILLDMETAETEKNVDKRRLSRHDKIFYEKGMMEKESHCMMT
jgi:hypothetical protein